MSYDWSEGVEEHISNVIHATPDLDHAQAWETVAEFAQENARSLKVQASLDRMNEYLNQLIEVAPEETEPVTKAIEYLDESFNQDGSTDWNLKCAEVLEDFCAYVFNEQRLDPEDTSECPEHGTQKVVRHETTRGSDPYDIEVLECDHWVICMGPGEPNTIVNRPNR